ncbi:MAG: putative aminotransferase [Acidobacteria bacterium]|nr:putative aminotransferase [Acidobacteriota bacterium]
MDCGASRRDVSRCGGCLKKPSLLSARELAALDGMLPEPEPRLELPPGRERIIPVADTLLDGNELRYVTECIQSNWVSSEGPFVRRFEEAFAAAAGCRFGVACSSGTGALHLLLATLGLQPGDEVILPAFTMIATANAVTYTGATPVLVDAEPRTWNLGVDLVERKITPRTRAIIAVHTYGHPVDADPLRALADKHRIHLLEDAAEGHGAVYRGRQVGSLGDAAVFSFYGNKIVTTGEGGMITTNDQRLADLARQLRGHAFSPQRHFWHEYLGFNYRMTNLQAAVGLAQTERLDDLVSRRSRNSFAYSEVLSDVPRLTLPAEADGVKNVFWMYALLVEEAFGCSRDELRRSLAAGGIETRSMFIPIHLQPIYHQAFRGERYPVAEALCRKGLYLPSGPGLSTADIAYVGSEIARIQRSVAGERFAGSFRNAEA